MPCSLKEPATVPHSSKTLILIHQTTWFHIYEDHNALILSWRYRQHVLPRAGTSGIPVKGHGGPQGCETLSCHHFLDNQLTDGGEVVSLTRWPPFIPTKIHGTYFWRRLSWPQGHSVAGMTRSIEKSNDLIGNQTCDLPAYIIVPQATALLHTPKCWCFIHQTTWHHI
jgi:hypothetical protein